MSVRMNGEMAGRGWPSRRCVYVEKGADIKGNIQGFAIIPAP